MLLSWKSTPAIPSGAVEAEAAWRLADEGALIFLGLLGTFYGLATTVPAVVDTIRSLAPSDDDSGVEIFGRLMTGLEAQLGGMGTAFASSLLGLAGSLVVGLLDLFTGHGQNRFYRELEEWLSTITTVGLSSAEGAGGPAYDASGAELAIHRMAEVSTPCTRPLFRPKARKAKLPSGLRN